MIDNKFKKSRDEMKHIISILKETYPDARCELEFKTPFELLVATILSAQTTDKKVNAVTEKLFKKYNTAYDYVSMKQSELEDYIREIGLFRNKAKNIISMCRVLIEKYNGEVPCEKDKLLELSGVGEKTANVVLINAFSVPAVPVDTHVFRVANRIGLVHAKTVIETQKQLMKNISKNEWIDMHHILIFHGRKTCIARKPKCEKCCVSEFCNYYLLEN